MSHSSALLRHSKYRPLTGGHAPSDLREAFIECLVTDGNPVELREQNVSLHQLCGLLWNCRDTMPSDVCYYVFKRVKQDVPDGSSYAQGARALRRME